jgi:divalent metal cation (Fe/Co/Zn/Cd) transporter
MCSATLCADRVPMTGPLDEPTARLRLVAASSIAVALVVTGLKFAAYWRSGSAALYSDAIESIVNVLTSLVALGAVHWALQPADRRHQFGHHKAEYFSAVVEGVLVVAAAFLILHEAWDAFLRPRPLHDLAAGMGLNAVAAALNAGWSAFLIAWGQRQRSPALVADRSRLGEADRLAGPRSGAGGPSGALHPVGRLAPRAFLGRRPDG